jgi:hypothetical protein
MHRPSDGSVRARHLASHGGGGWGGGPGSSHAVPFQSHIRAAFPRKQVANVLDFTSKVLLPPLVLAPRREKNIGYGWGVVAVVGAGPPFQSCVCVAGARDAYRV